MIIQATEGNLPVAAAIHSASWKDAHKSFCTPAFVALHSPERQLDYLRHELAAGKRLYLLINDVKRAVGIVTVQNSLIENLYVTPDEQRKGYGSTLLEFALKQCSGTPTLWILNNNQAAYALYTKYGFAKTGKSNRLSESLCEIEMTRTAPLPRDD